METPDPTPAPPSWATDAAAAHLDALMARPGMADRVAEIRARMAAEDRAAAAVDDADGDTR